MREVVVFLLMLAAAALLLGGCAGARQAAPQAGADQAAAGQAPVSMAVLPAPSVLAKGASTAPSDSDRYRTGSSYEPMIPYNRASLGSFTPTWNPPAQASFSDTAYMGYRLANMADYSGINRIKLAWHTPLPAALQVWVALSNYQTDSWNWFYVPGGESFSVPAFTPFVSPAGNMYAVVLVLGTGTIQLDWILAGENLKPLISLGNDLPSDPLARIAPLTVNFDASKSQSIGGTITGYDFDWESDGTWDILDDSDGLAGHIYGPGTYTFTVRATDDAGISGTLTLDFIAIDPANKQPVADFSVSTAQGVAPLSSDLDPALTSDPDGTIIKYEWDFDNDHAYDLVTTTPDVISHIFGILGINEVTLRVTDNFLATDTVTHTVECLNGWRRFVVDADVRLDEPLAVAVTGSGSSSRPCVAYQDFDSLDLRFVRSNDIVGSNWPAPVTPVPDSTEQGYSPTMIMGIDGMPLIAYGVHEPSSLDYHLFTVHAQDAAGSAWDAPVEVSPGNNVGSLQSMLLVNSLPSIAAVADLSGYGTSRILYFQCTDGNGGSWYPAQTALAAEDGMRYEGISLGLSGSSLFKRPFISFIKDHPTGPGDVCGLAASNIDGTAWNAPVLAASSYARHSSTMLVDGNPAIMAGSPYQGGNLYYGRAADASGGSFPGGVAQIGGGGYGNLIIFDGKPAACYYDFEGGDLWFVTALDAQGTSWGEPYQVDLAGYVGVYCRMVMSGGNPVIVYYDDTLNRIKAAYFELT